MCFWIFQMEVLYPLNWNFVDIRKLRLPIHFLLWSYRIRFSWYFRNFIYIRIVRMSVWPERSTLSRDVNCKTAVWEMEPVSLVTAPFKYLITHFTDGRRMLTKHPETQLLQFLSHWYGFTSTNNFFFWGAWKVNYDIFYTTTADKWPCAKVMLGCFNPCLGKI